MEYKCEECDTKLPLGWNGIRVQEGIVGQQGFISALDENALYFCNEHCLRDYYCKTAAETLQRRIP